MAIADPREKHGGKHEHEWNLAGHTSPVQDSGNYINLKIVKALFNPLKALFGPPKAKAPSLPPTKLSQELAGIDGGEEKEQKHDSKKEERKETTTRRMSKCHDRFGLVKLLVTFALTFTIVGLPVEGNPVSQAESATHQDLCIIRVDVTEPPISMNLNMEIPENIDSSTRCPASEEHFGTQACFRDDFVLQVIYKRGFPGKLFIQHGRGRVPAILLNTNGCTPPEDDQPERVLEERRNKGIETTVEVFGRESLKGVGVLLVILFLLGFLCCVRQSYSQRAKSINKVYQHNQYGST